jgi:RNA polymerase sigma-70 factor, ECF subfamily
MVGHRTFDECFREHYASLVAYGGSLTGDRELARELAQEAFLRLHTNWIRVADYDDQAAWLRRVVTNLVIDRYRSQRSERRAPARIQSASASPDELADLETWSELVSALPTRQRAIVTLHYGEDMSIADVAALLEISPNTVKSALSKARELLRAQWEVHGRA